MRLAIIGSRTFEDFPLLVRWANFLLEGSSPGNVEIVSGGCKRGGDKLAKRYAHNRGFAYKEFPADWERLGRRAGFIRNRDIVAYSHSVLAFWDCVSNGTKHTINTAAELYKPVTVVTFKLVGGSTQALFDWSG
jgi:predicted Rossmann fold nucleotide-binding protein DprA/Smf involved in DNA uptake